MADLGMGEANLFLSQKYSRLFCQKMHNALYGNNLTQFVDEVEQVLPIPNKGNRDANDTINDGLNDSVMTTYTIISSNPGILGKDIADISGKSIPTIDRHIAILIKEDLIEHRDSKKTGGYYAK